MILLLQLDTAFLHTADMGLLVPCISMIGLTRRPLDVSSSSFCAFISAQGWRFNAVERGLLPATFWGIRRPCLECAAVEEASDEEVDKGHELEAEEEGGAENEEEGMDGEEVEDTEGDEDVIGGLMAALEHPA